MHGTRTLWLMRHGKQTSTNEPGVCQPNAPLSPEGREQVLWAKGHLIKSQSFAFLCSSPWQRARETAELIEPDGKWQFTARLRPQNNKKLDEIYDTPEPPRDLKELDERDSDILTNEKAAFIAFMAEVVRKLPVNGHALLITHLPLTDLAREELAEDIVQYEQRHGHGEIYQLRFKLVGPGCRYSKFEHLQLPPELRTH